MTLDNIAELLTGESVYIGFMPDKTDQVVALFDYSSEGDVTHFFEGIESSMVFQVRVRDIGYEQAFRRATSIIQTLGQYKGLTFTIRQISPLLDIGQDTHNPPRREITINFKAMRRI